ncbi:nuclear transport factor 2 family protein [Streptomyces sp. TE5632]
MVTEYAGAVDAGDREAYRGLFTADGRADHPSAGGIEGDAGKVAAWLAESLRVFPVRQLPDREPAGALRGPGADTGGTARVQADYVSPMGPAGTDGGPAAPDFVCGGRYAFATLRTDDGRRLHEVVVREKRRRPPGRPTAPVVH